MPQLDLGSYGVQLIGFIITVVVLYGGLDTLVEGLSTGIKSRSKRMRHQETAASVKKDKAVSMILRGIV